jgi:hypothetical protein
LVEQAAVNRRVVGSSPTLGALKQLFLIAIFFSVGCGGGTQAPASRAAITTTASTTTTPVVKVDASWGPIGNLVGAWEGTNDDKSSSGTVTIQQDLGGKILVRRGTNESAQGHHEDFSVISHAHDGTLHADYYDNEGHVIRYGITASADGKQFVFASEGPDAAPRFRLTYTLKTDDDLEILFEMAPPGATEFHKFTGGTVHRKR